MAAMAEKLMQQKKKVLKKATTTTTLSPQQCKQGSLMPL
jgi:hypothetical protein